MSKKKVKTDNSRRFPLSAGFDFVHMKAKQRNVNPFSSHQEQHEKKIDAQPFLRAYDLTLSDSHMGETHAHERQLVERLNAFALALL